MRVLVACEFSATVREAFKAKGHEAWSCDLLPTEVPGLHYQGNIFDILDEEWDLLIAHPPCTYLCNSGVRWLHEDPERIQWMRDAAGFMNMLLQADIPKICVENPIQHRYARQLIPLYTQIIQSWHHGHAETKATCLWLKGLPELQPTNIVNTALAQRIHRLSPSKDRWKERSRTYQGIAQAMADQWG